MVSTKDIPRPMIHGNWESVSDKCFIGQHFTDSVCTRFWTRFMYPIPVSDIGRLHMTGILMFIP